MKQYETYKESGIDWIWNFPSHWEVKKAKYIFDEIKMTGFEHETILSVSKGKGLIPRTDMEQKVVNADKNLDKFKLVTPNQFIIHLRSFQSGFEMSTISGIVSPAYTILQGGNDVNPGYFKRLFHSETFISKLASLVLSLRDGKPISFADFGELYLPLPSLKEQHLMATYLDQHVDKVDLLVEKKRAQIERLREYRQSLITESVTKGLDPDAPIKDSGVEWIGAVPAHWEVSKLKRFAHITRGTADKKTKENEIPVNLVQYTNVYYKPIQQQNDDDYLPITVTKHELEFSQVKRGDVLLTASSETSNDIGRSTVVYEDLNNHVFGSDVIRLRVPQDELELSFRKYLFDNYYFLSKLNSLTRGVTRFRFNMDDFRSLFFVIPPFQEQKEISAYLDEKTNYIASNISNITTQIDRLEEYKRSLIYEVVTGKRKVEESDIEGELYHEA
ncbi:restriction endonuclease subunit S [Pontibacillus yanchengensis]|uniref:Restriction endonuclease subunit S n=1 Tax=Pontibacillus yanchengensis TaxID=462910 RepID=A0A6I5A5M8_9BACI|nr:restriction endonuclease subunit S [Pontibacillus yanchengensis]MYL35568.1 restriction endonuclease subunit S [Pontibacillus yanchengensis]